jgi:hypothetical protein
MDIMTFIVIGSLEPEILLIPVLLPVLLVIELVPEEDLKVITDTYKAAYAAKCAARVPFVFDINKF